MLKDILMRLSDRGINVIDARVKTSHGKPASIDLRVELESVNQLELTINQIRSMAVSYTHLTLPTSDLV